MPIKKCQHLGKKGWKYGEHGKCYHEEEKAKKQGAAIKASQKKKRG